MVKTGIVLVIAAACGGCLGQRWTARDYAMEAAFVLVEAADYRQTRIITARCRESNPLIGPCGQNLPINLFFPITVAANALVADLLPGWWRTAFQGFTVGVEADVVLANFNAGVR